MQDGACAEMALVGREGIVGIALFLGDGSMPISAVVICAGTNLRLDRRIIREAFDESGPVMHLMLRYTQALITQMTQDLMAEMPGMRRESVSASLQKLQRAGLTGCTRGPISILDRAGMEPRACECYAAVRRDYERPLPRRPAA